MINRFIPLIILLVAGCATPREVNQVTYFTLDTNPQGATVICDGEDMGYTPTTLPTFAIGENGTLTDEEVAKFIEYTEIAQGLLKVGENKYHTNEETLEIIEKQKNRVKSGLSDCTAYWSSGVSKKFPPHPLLYKYVGNETFIYTLQRPEGEGYTQDAEFALKVKQLNQDQNNADRNASIAISAVQAQNRAAQAQERGATAQERQNTKSTTCTTTFGVTTCY